MAGLHEAADDLGEPPTRAASEEWRRERDAPSIGHGAYTDPPGIRGRADWCHLARVATAGTNAWSPVECIYALCLAARSVEDPLSKPKDAAWRTEQPDVSPTAAASGVHWSSFPAAQAVTFGDSEAVDPREWEA